MSLPCVARFRVSGAMTTRFGSFSAPRTNGVNKASALVGGMLGFKPLSVKVGKQSDGAEPRRTPHSYPPSCGRVVQRFAAGAKSLCGRTEELTATKLLPLGHKWEGDCVHSARNDSGRTVHPL
jgi:hypothetical protein